MFHKSKINIKILNNTKLNFTHLSKIISDKGFVLKKRRNLLNSIVSEVEKINFNDKDPPEIKIKFISDLNEIEKTSATVALEAKNISRFGSN